ncbi:MAG: hypothetical protein HQL58_12280 [Magnetococcales bacterium]|nr:hypothetical protein [Magnetococcales bacterium]
MDGIYSAGRELKEKGLLDRAIEQARSNLAHGSKGFANQALKLSRRNGGAYRSRWPELFYLCRIKQDQGSALQAIGSALTELNLWPIALSSGVSAELGDLDKAMILSQQLLQNRRKRPDDRVDWLKLPNKESETGQRLQEFLQEHDSLSDGEILQKLREQPQFWLGNIHPEIFQPQLQSISVISWRRKDRQPYAWSGLDLEEDDRLAFKLPRAEAARQKIKLEVRWEVDPQNLPARSVEYRVVVQAGNDILSGRTVSHHATAQQRCMVTVQPDLS